jgi:tRNA(adenine34) deaminase
MTELNHQFFMQKALLQAKKAFIKKEVPVGAIIVDAKGTILARSYNLVEARHTQAAHAEIRALIKAGKKLGDWRLNDCWLYVTLEPCAMCMNLIILSRMKGVVYGATSLLFGYHLVDKKDASWVYKKDTPAIIGGIRSDESIALLKKFFKDKRESQP